ncbi:MAG TPA: cyclic nucleotide-binding domain-containing protein [Desulfosalsimonadaceae bacterium]|nr:cyclic nucleotide-binding domain-containing protein [Desulfosalsimonadaceae bacterium]
MQSIDRSQQEAKVDQYVAQNDTASAISLLYDLVAAYAKEKKFEKADALHNKMYEVDAMALTEIVRSSEIIEAEKSEILDPEHLELWSDLYNQLNTTEANALYYSMKSATFESGETIMEQGRLNSRMYFILKGEVNALYTRGDTEVLVKTLSSGDIIGQAPFFSATVCTVTMNASSRVKASFLENSVLKQWKTDVPALEANLYEYCVRKDRVKQEIENKQMERRTDKRLELAGRLSFQLLDKTGNPMGKSYKGEIADISVGGLSFVVKSSKEETLRLLLGRQILVSFELPLVSGDARSVSEKTTTIAIQALVFDDYSIHVKFQSKKSRSFIEDIDRSRAVQPA